MVSLGSGILYRVLVFSGRLCRDVSRRPGSPGNQQMQRRRMLCAAQGQQEYSIYEVTFLSPSLCLQCVFYWTCWCTQALGRWGRFPCSDLTRRARFIISYLTICGSLWGNQNRETQWIKSKQRRFLVLHSKSWFLSCKEYLLGAMSAWQQMPSASCRYLCQHVSAWIMEKAFAFVLEIVSPEHSLAVIIELQFEKPLVNV